MWSSRAQDGPVSEVLGSGGSPVLPRWQIRAAFFRAGWSRREPIPWILLDDGGSMIAHRKRLSPVTRRVILISGDHHVSTTAGGDDGCGVETLSRLAFLADTHPPRRCHRIGEVQPSSAHSFEVPAGTPSSSIGPLRSSASFMMPYDVGMMARRCKTLCLHRGSAFHYHHSVLTSRWWYCLWRYTTPLAGDLPLLATAC